MSRRTLFKSAKKTPFKEEKDSKHHEYSIRPDTFAFKVSSTESTGVAHPLQKDPQHEKFNVLDFIYRNTTNYPFQDKSPQDVFNRYPMTTSGKSARLQHRPRRSKMLVSDFIEDSLYNPHYGYFSKEVEIFHSDKPFDYQNIEDVDGFMDAWKQAYQKYDQEPESEKKKAERTTQKQSKAVAKRESPGRLARTAEVIQKQDMQVAEQSVSSRSLQLWHTPTELFNPYYGEALARYIVVYYKLNGQFPYEDLIIYEMGGGNGTLMCNILNYIRKNEPDIYKRTQYKIIEISSQLAMKQFSSALEQKLIKNGLDRSKLEIINKSIFKWDKVVESPCFFIALEVFDNFAHDLVRYDLTTGQPHEGHVVVNEDGDFYEFFVPQLSSYTNAFLALREKGLQSVLNQQDTMAGKLSTARSLVPFTNNDSIHPLLQSSTKLALKNRILPLTDNLGPGEFIPTRLLQFFQILKHKFPNHSLILSDFSSLPNTIGGYYNSPVVQTVVKDRMVDVSTYMVHQGYFDIMFATDFELAKDLYRQITGKIAKVELHKDFLEQWADIDVTTTKKGENPMLDFYKNVNIMVT